MMIGLDIKINKSMEHAIKLNLQGKMTMSIDDIAIHVYILSIWVQWYYRVCLHPVTAYVRVNMVTAWLPVVSLSNDQCQNVSICHCVCLPIVIRFLFLIYKDTSSSSSSSLWTSLSTAHKNSYCQSFISFLYSRAVVKTSLFTVKCHFVTYISTGT